MTTLAPRPTIHRDCVRSWTDENTGREVRQLTNLPHGAHLGYFRVFKQLPDGRVLAWAKHDAGNLLAIDPETGGVEPIPHKIHGTLKLRERDGRMWYIRSSTPPAAAAAGDGSPKVRRPRTGREVWSVDLPAGEPTLLAKVPDEVPGVATDITCDGRLLILLDTVQDTVKYPIPTTKDVGSIWHFFNRPRKGAIWTYDLQSGATARIYETDGICPLHLDTSPADPTLLRFCHDMYDAYGQRVWTIRTDGSGLTRIRPQQYGELVTHEFWWADPNYIGYTYQDRRGDETTETLPWAEYSPRPTHLGIADLSGREVFFSGPLNSYHSHLYMSPRGDYVCGEGTEGHSFVYAAAFDWKNPATKMVPLATIHTPYVPFRGQGVDCNFSADSRWLIYADKVGGAAVHQLFAVRVDL